MRRFALLAAICWLPLAACTTPGEDEGTPSADAGDAVRHNIAAQVVNPQAPSGAAPRTLDGKRAALAQDRYVTGKVIVPEDMDKSTGNSNSSSGNGAGSGSSQ